MSVDNLYISTLNFSHYLVAPLCAVMAGLDKGGIPGLAALGMTLLVSGHPEGGIGKVIATFVPILLIADLGACYVYRDAVDWTIIKLLVVPMFAGIIAGVLLMGVLDDNHVKRVVGIALMILAISNFIIKCSYSAKKKNSESLLPITYTKSDNPLRGGTDSISCDNRKRGDSESSNSTHKVLVQGRRKGDFVVGMTCGFITGILTMVANVAGPIVTAYFLSLEIPKRELNATRGYLFLIANLIKIPVQVLLGNLELSDLSTVFFLIIIALISTLIAERYIISCIDQKSFEILSWLLVVVGAGKLLLDSSPF